METEFKGCKKKVDEFRGHAWLERFRKGNVDMSPQAGQMVAEYVDKFLDSLLIPAEPPAVHLNGTSEVELLRGLLDAARALREAIDKVHKTAPNGRDYYVKESVMAFTNAKIKHVRRMEMLDYVLDSLLEELDAVSSAIDSKA